MRITLAATALLAVAAISIAIAASVWSECRADHSWLYCIHLISK